MRIISVKTANNTLNMPALLPSEVSTLKSLAGTYDFDSSEYNDVKNRVQSLLTIGWKQGNISAWVPADLNDVARIISFFSLTPIQLVPESLSVTENPISYATVEWNFSTTTGATFVSLYARSNGSYTCFYCNHSISKNLSYYDVVSFTTYVVDSSIGLDGTVPGLSLSFFFRADTQKLIISYTDIYFNLDSRYSGPIYQELVGSSVEVSDDPFTPNLDGPGGSSWSGGGPDGSGGGFGSFDYHSDANADLNPANLHQITDSGMCTIHVSSDFTALKNLAAYLWSGSFDIDNFRKMFANPMDCILGCNIIPATVGITASTVKVGNIDTKVSYPRATARFVEQDLGSLYISSDSLSHTFLDFAPYLNCHLYLPFVGFVTVSANDVIDRTLSIKYYIDIMSGAFVANVYSTSDDGAQILMYSYAGNCATPVPVTAGQYANGYQTTTQLAVSTMAAMAAVAAVSAASGGAGAGATSTALAPANDVEPVYPISEPGPTSSFNPVKAGAAAQVAQGGLKSIRDMITPTVTHSGNIGCAAGYMNYKYAFIMFTAPNLAVPKNFGSYKGHNTYDVKSLGSLSGYTEVSYIHLNCTATDAERAEILTKLFDGVIL